MSISTILIAFWLYAGRSLLLCMNSACGSKHDNARSFSTSLALGLLIPPGLLAVLSWWNLAFHGTLVALICLDLFLLYKFIRSVNDNHLAIHATAIILVVFTLVVFTLSYFNGPFIEHLPDSWWHMKNISWMINNNTLLLPTAIHGEPGTIDTLISYVGIDYASYRLQALLTWVVGCSVLESWISTSMVVSTILGLSIFLLFYSLRRDNLTLVISLLFWLVLFGGMNTGLRLGGWPAGMGYVFLNLGLLASYRLFRTPRSREAWILLSLSAFGAAMFHLAELFLLSIAFASLLITRAFFNNSSLSRSVIVFLGYSVLIIIAYIVVSNQPFATTPIIFSLALLLCTGWILGILYFRINRKTFIFLSILFVCTVLLIVVDLDHLIALFTPDIVQTAGYYSDYIPQSKLSWNRQYLVISKWAHQLRASILWSGIISLFLAIWLFLNGNQRLNQWFLVLMFVPWIILTSPAVFTLLSSFVPMYGVYRVQYLMPTAAVLGFSTSYAGRQLFLKDDSGSVKVDSFTNISLPRIGTYLSTNSLLLVLIFFGIYITHLLFIKALDNFMQVPPMNWIGPILLTACVITCVRKISAKKILNLSILIVCTLLLISDLVVRLGITGERPWAIKPNTQFHWLLRDNRKTITFHTSWRYKKDLEYIRKLTNNDDSVGFLSDLATSYYVAAETKLQPLVQQAHHSKSGLRFNEFMLSFCNSETTSQDFLRKIYTINTRRGKARAPVIQYIIVNRDTNNYTAEVFGMSCVGEISHLESELENIAKLIFNGNHLSLWRIRE